MPTSARDLERVARVLGFVKVRQRGSHARWVHPDGRATTIPMHPGAEIGGWLLHAILGQMGIDATEFRRILGG